MLLNINNKAQSVAEYSICLAIILLALVTMNFYVKRGLQGRYRDLTDYTTAKATGSLGQYEPYYKDPLATTDNSTAKKIVGNMGLGGGLLKKLPSPDNYMETGGVSNPETEETIKNALP